ncbi:MAG: DUF483 domain-containing protein [Myxococcales bacterium]|nr:DUF483 domain-containing protein [Myxococcales bacterium]
MLQRYQLRHVYASLRSALRQRDWAAATIELGVALGITLPPPPKEIAIRQAADLLRGHLSYRGFKPAELAMLHGKIKNLVKFEDIPVEQARQFAQQQRQYSCVALSSPYRKDYLLLRTSPAQADDPRALATVYVSVDRAAEVLCALEAQQREDPRKAGALLEIPDCCVQAFVHDSDRARRDQDTLNDDACRRLLATAAQDSGGDWRLNPLANEELLGFYPCSSTCSAAIGRANLVLAAMDCHVAAAAQERLGRTALYFRLPFFATLSASPADGRLASGLLINAFADPLARTAQALFAAHLCQLAEQADSAASVPVDDRAATLVAVLAKHQAPASAPPLVARWR